MQSRAGKRLLTGLIGIVSRTDPRRLLGHGTTKLATGRCTCKFHRRTREGKRKERDHSPLTLILGTVLRLASPEALVTRTGLTACPTSSSPTSLMPPASRTASLAHLATTWFSTTPILANTAASLRLLANPKSSRRATAPTFRRRR